MTNVVYVVDHYGWALHAIGEWLQDALAPHGVTLEITTPEEWAHKPRHVDTIYLAYSGLLGALSSYRPYARRLLTTVHDPCEISRFEDRDDWEQRPLCRLSFAGVDKISAISSQLTAVLERRYGVVAELTTTWSPRAALIRALAEGEQEKTRQIRAVSSTRLLPTVPWRLTFRRMVAAKSYLLDERGRLTHRQLPAIWVRRTRKRIDRLEAIGKALAGDDRIVCQFTTGAEASRPRDEYEDSLRTADIYVCTSSMEGGPLPVLEAVMAGLAVLSTPVGQVEDWVEDGASGFICRTVEDFVARLQDYADDPELLRRHQARARVIAKQLVPDVNPWLRFLTQ